VSRRPRLHALLTGCLAALLAAACGAPATPPAPPPDAGGAATQPPAPPPASGEVIRGLAQVDSVDVQVLEGIPPQVNAVVRGSLADSCTMISGIAQLPEGNTIRVEIGTSRPADAACAAAIVPFEQTIALDMAGLPAGSYTVSVNGVTAAFDLSAGSVPVANGSIGGIVWEDVCNPAGEGAEVGQPPPGCVAVAGGGYAGDGHQVEPEPSLLGIVVSLGSGPCPSTGLATATTGEGGHYLFPELPPGDYCVTLEPLVEPNLSLLVPGTFTFPAYGVNSHAVTLVEGESRSGVDFGWDYQLK
jgi:inhibitor of cysteine peptidase